MVDQWPVTTRQVQPAYVGESNEIAHLSESHIVTNTSPTFKKIFLLKIKVSIAKVHDIVVAWRWKKPEQYTYVKIEVLT